MEIIVQKFGGTSVKDEAARIQALKHVQYAVDQGDKVIVVVSAIGRKGAPYATDSLLGLVGAEHSRLTNRELDMLVSVGETISTAVFTELARKQGLNVTAMTGHDAGIITNDDFQNAKILRVDPKPITDAFIDADVVVVTGFQGATESGHITTIGRGGSDTSAAILGAALKAKRVDIFTDVNGMMTADPRLVTHARFIKAISYEELANMAHEGAKVIHPRAVEIAEQAHVPMRIRSTYQEPDELGTLVTDRTTTQIEHYRTVTGIAHQTNLTQFTVPTDTLSSSAIFQLMAQHGLSVDFINITPHQVVFNLVNGDAAVAKQLLTDAHVHCHAIADCAKVSVVGAGITGTPGVTARIVTALSAQHIDILQSTDSYTTIWVLVKEADLKAAMNALHDEFLGIE
ncbi:aspartate kinase [Lactiplantibacillus paraplantarum]|uniref:Aspartokinase n=1 Tax=Lactiplantibacillus paraplantarum TaxID=60520 RepID=A0A2I9CXB8_9LACO|nr:aspartate kinase [Lactiplantibacillus paraplantarum]AVW09798.1 aspartate kinase [Lactiplantibacillus paraplantarum]AYJ38009.1 aspartate kinase [Lactiplantibacillus paraplantarum]ERL45492.1 aspartate kinase I [Lactiplantibacillus paraplantarum]KRL50231.1 aspartate kinase [Lactiplantibacillus paraplantarum DSM 10667]MCU4682974.1 aspartate kinase [Lactiplantibacillus paraplantarum]